MKWKHTPFNRARQTSAQKRKTVAYSGRLSNARFCRTSTARSIIQCLLSRGTRAVNARKHRSNVTRPDAYHKSLLLLTLCQSMAYWIKNDYCRFSCSKNNNNTIHTKVEESTNKQRCTAQEITNKRQTSDRFDATQQKCVSLAMKRYSQASSRRCVGAALQAIRLVVGSTASDDGVGDYCNWLR